LRGVSDLLAWVLGDRPDAPLGSRILGLPTASDLALEENPAEDLIARQYGGSSGAETSGARLRYGESIQMTIRWMRGEVTAAPVDSSGAGHDEAP
jgi:hypothetical protein